MTEALHTKYRPTCFEDVVGQDQAVRALRGILERQESQAFLFSGPAGTGKTTLARQTAVALGCEPNRIHEISGSIYTGVDSMREILDILRYKPFGISNHRAILIDEAHRLSKQAWDALLKDIEEPPTDSYWLFCTTEVHKIPNTIKTRCSHFNLKPVPHKELTKLIKWVCEQENIKLAEGVLDMILDKSGGSPRQALANLSLTVTAQNRREAADLIEAGEETDASLALCRFLSDGRGSWVKAMSLVDALEDESPEGIRILVCNYIGKAIRGARDDKTAIKFLSILENFKEPYNSSEGMGPLMISIGRTLLGG